MFGHVQARGGLGNKVSKKIGITGLPGSSPSPTLQGGTPFSFTLPLNPPRLLNLSSRFLRFFVCRGPAILSLARARDKVPCNYTLGLVDQSVRNVTAARLRNNNSAGCSLSRRGSV